MGIQNSLCRWQRWQPLWHSKLVCHSWRPLGHDKECKVKDLHNWIPNISQVNVTSPPSVNTSKTLHFFLLLKWCIPIVIITSGLRGLLILGRSNTYPRRVSAPAIIWGVNFLMLRVRMVVPAMSSHCCQLILEVKLAPLIVRSIMCCSCLALLSCCLVIHPYMMACLFRKYIEIDLSCVLAPSSKAVWKNCHSNWHSNCSVYQWMAVLLDAFIKYVPSELERRNEWIHNPLIPAPSWFIGVTITKRDP